MGRKLISSAIVVLLVAAPSWGKKKTPEFSAIEITRFSKPPGAELTPNFLDYLYEELFGWVSASGVFARVIGEDEVVPASEARRSLTLRGSILEYGRGSTAKSLLGFGIGRRSLEAQITLVRRMDNATVFETQIKVRSRPTSDEKYLALYLAKQVAKKIEKNTKSINAALREADKRYVPPPAETVAAKVSTSGQPAANQQPASAGDAKQRIATKPAEPAAPAPTSQEDTSASEAEAASAETPEEPGTVLVTSDLSGAEVYVDDAFVGNTPATLKLSPGRHSIRVALAGQEDWIRQLSVLPGSELKVSANHAPKPSPPEPAPPEPDSKALSKQEILGLLTNYVPNARIASLVREHGIKFTPTAEDLREITGAGGDNNLVEAVKQAASQTDR